LIPSTANKTKTKAVLSGKTEKPKIVWCRKQHYCMCIQWKRVCLSIHKALSLIPSTEKKWAGGGIEREREREIERERCMKPLPQAIPQFNSSHKYPGTCTLSHLLLRTYVWHLERKSTSKSTENN
jgi:hypothetical protein